MGNMVYKSIKQGPQARKVYTTHKKWTVTDETQTLYGVVSYSGQYSNGDWNISDAQDTNVANEPLTSGNYYEREIFDSVHNLYYRNPENSFESGENKYFSQQERNLQRFTKVLTIPTKIYGDRIRESSVTMSTATANIFDDGVGNLRDSNITEQTGFKTIPLQDCYMKLDFLDGWKHQTGNIDTDSTITTPNYVDIRDACISPFRAEGYNVAYEYYTSSIAPDGTPLDGGLTGSTFINFHGSGSTTSASNSYICVKDSFMLGEQPTRAWDNDFALSLWVKVPPSQSVTQSYIGDFTDGMPENSTTTYPPSDKITRALVDTDHSVIVTSRGVLDSEHSIPWELQVVNQRNGDAISEKPGGYLKFLRGKGGTESFITSSLVNDGVWHHVVIQIATSSMELYVDNVVQQTAVTDPVSDSTVFDPNLTDIHLGARKYGFLTKEWYDARNSSETSGFFGTQGNYTFPFSGSVDMFRLYKRSLKTTEINSLYTYKRQDNIIGNVFYSHGMLVFTDTSGSYKGSSLFNDYSLQFKGSVDRTVHNYQCVVRDDEYNVTLNPTARVGYNINNPTLKPFTTSSDFNPYITTIGLYNDSNQLLAIGKLAYPVRSPEEIDISFNVQFDS